MSHEQWARWREQGSYEWLRASQQEAARMTQREPVFVTVYVVAKPGMPWSTHLTLASALEEMRAYVERIAAAHEPGDGDSDMVGVWVDSMTREELDAQGQQGCGA